METKLTNKLMVSFLAVISMALLMTSLVSAFVPDEIAAINTIKINDVVEEGIGDISVIAGETASITVSFQALEDASDVRMRVEIEGTRVDSKREIFVGDIEEGKRYVRTLVVDVPYELRDEKSGYALLNLKIWNGDYRTYRDNIVLRIQRPSYNVEVMSLNAKSSIRAGETLSVEVVLKNTGYNDLRDLYVTAFLPSLGIGTESYLGKLEPLDGGDEENVEGGRLFLDIPYDVPQGKYALEVRAVSRDLVFETVGYVTIENDFENSIIVDQSKKSGLTNERVSYDLIIVNPTSSLKVYRIALDSSDSLSLESSDSIVSIPAGSSKTVRVTGLAKNPGEYEFKVDLLSGEKIVDSTDLRLKVDKGVSEPIVVLTILLAITFVVLLVVLVVLLTKKPKKEEEFGESYY